MDDFGDVTPDDTTARVLRAADALAWARERLPKLVAAGAESAVLELLVHDAVALTGAPEAWAATWDGDPMKGKASFRALAVRSRKKHAVPEPTGLSRSIVGHALRDGRAAWSDDARTDARWLTAGSVVAFELRSVGCVPLGKRGVLYVFDPSTPGRFGAEERARLSALCALATPFIERGDTPAPRRPTSTAPGLVGDTPVMRELFAAIRAFAPMPWPALILGETGTGKEAVARAVHQLSPKRDKPFVAVNCAAIPEELAESTLFGHERGAFTGADKRKEGLVERAHGGTLFLDEVGELSARVQPKLLRLLQESRFERVGGDRELPFDGRIVAATHRPIDDGGAFREDLYHRLAACVLTVPPLRDRTADVPALAADLLHRALAEIPGAPKLVLSADAVRWLAAQDWPGNVRDLSNALRAAIARAMARGLGTIDPVDFAPRARTQRSRPAPVVANLHAATEAFQKECVMAAIAAASGNKSRAAEQLGVSRQWLHRLIERWGE